MNLQQILRPVVDLARKAGDEIMRIYTQDDFGATRKADESPLTLADLAAHRTIVAGLTTLTPDIPILSEEASDISYAVRSKWTRFWLVDPLDGTKEFIKRNGEFTVNIALVENCKPILGVVYAPVLETCYLGAAGCGAFKISKADRPNFSLTSSLLPLPPGEGWGEDNAVGKSGAITSIRTQPHQDGHPIKVVASRSHSDARTQTLLNTLGNHECISMGSSLKLCLVAEGAAHFYPRLGPTMEWDTAAAHAVVNAAGGKVCDTVGNELHYNKEDLHNPEFFVYDGENDKLQKLIREKIQ